MRSSPAGTPLRLLIVVAGLFNIGVGLWSFFDPSSFFDRVALFPPYNVHLLHDIGAFQVGLGVALWLALVWSDALVVVLASSAAAATLHGIAHFLDRDLGGHPTTDIPLLGLLALLLVVATAIRYRHLRGVG